MPFVQSDGARIWWRVDGRQDAPALLMVSSLGTDHSMWDPVMPALTQAFRVVRLDKRGHGASDVPPGDYSMEQLGRDALAVADAAGLDRFHYAGLSIGGMIGMWLLANAPQRIERAVLANTSAQMPPGAFDERIAAVRAGGMAAIADVTMSRWFTAPYLARRTPQMQTIRQGFLAVDPVGYVGCCAAIRDMALVPLLPRITAPVLVIAGASDPSTPPERGREIADAIPGARYAQLPAAHLSHMEQPARFADWVVRFLRGDDPTAGATGAYRHEADRYALGVARRKALLGDAYVEERLTRTPAFAAAFQDLVTRYCWGEVWTRPGLDDRTRRLAVLAMTIGQARWEEFRLHVDKGLAAGLDLAELEELLLQAAVYCGVPAANTAFHHALEVIAARDAPR